MYLCLSLSVGGSKSNTLAIVKVLYVTSVSSSYIIKSRVRIDILDIIIIQQNSHLSLRVLTYLTSLC